MKNISADNVFFLVNPIKLVYSNHDRYLKIIFYQFVNVCEKDKESKNA